MPMWRKGKGVWIKICESCNKPFQKKNKTQKKCERCIDKYRKLKINS